MLLAFALEVTVAVSGDVVVTYQAVVPVAGTVGSGMAVSEIVVVEAAASATVSQHYVHERTGYQITVLGPGLD